MNDHLTPGTKEWYARYYEKTGQWRNDVLRNPEVPFQLFATDAALLTALRQVHIEPESASLLDVGCGSGSGLLSFLRFGFNPLNLHGLDLQPDRLDEARRRVPSSVSLTLGDACRMPYPDGTFDVVFESTMLVLVVDDVVARNITAEMLRVCKPGGHVVLSDWRYSKPFNPDFNGVSKSRLRRLFPLGERCHLLRQHNGALIPPLGRFLSKYAAPLYFPCRWAAPFLCGQVVTVLRKA